jgi:hypothetical protein
MICTLHLILLGVIKSRMLKGVERVAHKGKCNVYKQVWLGNLSKDKGAARGGTCCAQGEVQGV